MKKVVLLVIFTGFMICSKAQYQMNFIDSLGVDTSNQYTVESVNLTGNFTELVVAVGFPDRPATQGIPQLTDNNDKYPVLETFEDGTLPQDYIATIHFNSNIVDEIKHFPSLIS